MPNRADFDFDRYGQLSFPVFYAQSFYEAWSNDSTQPILAAVGTAVIALTVFRLAVFIWGFIRPSTLPRYCHSVSGSWALVTGASDGIGRAFVDEFLERGFNVLMHSRNPEKLQRIKDELAEKYPRRTIDFVVADASRSDHPEQAVVEKVKSLPGQLTVLCNNVGGVTTYPQYFTHGTIPTKDIDTQINMNARFPTHLTQALLPILQANKPALILNCGSAGGVYGVPYIVTYCATKGFIHAFTRSLSSEMACEGIDKDVEVMGFIIGNTRSAGNTSEMPFFTIDARDCVQGCFARVGSGKAIEYASWRHAVLSEGMSMLPERFLKASMIGEMKGRMAQQEKDAKKQ